MRETGALKRGKENIDYGNSKIPRRDRNNGPSQSFNEIFNPGNKSNFLAANLNMLDQLENIAGMTNARFYKKKCWLFFCWFFLEPFRNLDRINSQLLYANLNCWKCTMNLLLLEDTDLLVGLVGVSNGYSAMFGL